MTFIYKDNLIEYDYIYSNHPRTILFLHGWGGNKNSFVSCIKYFQHRYNIITISMPPSPLSTLPLSMYDYKKLVLQILHINNIPNVIIVCHSFGMRVSLMLATTNLNIEKIVIAGGAGIILTPKLMTKLNQQHNKILINKHPRLFNKFASEDYKNLSCTNRQTFKKIINKNLTQHITLLKCPVLLFWGKHDTATPIKYLKVFISIHKNSKVKLVGGSHFAYLEYSQLFIDEIDKFLNN